jgi:TolB-like protein/class 3 adenylate cyclase/cytochrome c-type biogenesis protein CcmH/NrfG
MAEERAQRRLAAILAADVAGYSRLMGENEAGTLVAVTSHISEVFEPEITAHHGRIFKTMGDAVFAEFASVVDAVQCAIVVQERMLERNSEIPEERRINFRIGVNLGDVIVQDDDIYGDGVNVAARLEGLAMPSGICVSGTVYEHVHRKLDLGFVDLGDQQVKNIAEPVRVYRVRTADGGEEVSQTSKEAEDASAAPDKPSVAVLPFTNVSRDPEQEFISDGIAEDIITTLSKIPHIFVIARNSSFRFKGQSNDPIEVARELGVRYVLEGSVRRTGNRIRVNAELVDGLSGQNVWGERYDRELADIFDLQDELTKEIVTALRINLTDGEQARVWLRSTNNVEAWSFAMQGMDLVFRATPTDNAEARRLYEKAFELDPNYIIALVWLGWTHWFDVRFGYTEEPERSLELADEVAQRAMELDPYEGYVHGLMAGVFALQKRFEDAVVEGRRALNGYPNDAWLRAVLARVLVAAGKPSEAERLIRDAMRMNPFYPEYYLGIRANALENMDNTEEALEVLKLAVHRNPDYFPGHLRLASLLGLAGRLEEAAAASSEVLRINPRFTLAQADAFYRSSDPRRLERFCDGLREAGLPE